MYLFFFFNDTATTEIYTLSLHDALPISGSAVDHEGSSRIRTGHGCAARATGVAAGEGSGAAPRWSDGRWLASIHLRDRKSTRLNSSHANISYAVFCLKKKK